MNASPSHSFYGHQSSPRLSRRVRFNSINFIATAWQRNSRTSKVLLLVSMLIVVTQIVTTTAVLTVINEKQCDKPLDIYLIVYAGRALIALPFQLYQHLHHPAHWRQQQRREQPFPQHARQPPPAATPLALSEERREHPSNDPRHSPSEALVLSPAPSEIFSSHSTPSTMIPWFDRIKTLLDVFAVLWFIVGNYLIFTSDTCPRDAPALFYTALTWILLGYLVILVPILLCAAIIFCLPCVLVVMRTMRFNEASGVVGGTQEEINKVTVYRFNANKTAIQQEHTATEPDLRAHNTRSTSVVVKFKRFWWQRIVHRQHKSATTSDHEEAYPDLCISPADEAMCSICLSEYEENELLCKLWCGHHFHKSCVHEWLVLNSKCPLCKQDFRGKEYDKQDA